jgi:hypothetical protein
MTAIPMTSAASLASSSSGRDRPRNLVLSSSSSVRRQDACDDGGFEEVSLHGDDEGEDDEERDVVEAHTPVNEWNGDFRDFNTHFPMRR